MPVITDDEKLSWREAELPDANPDGEAKDAEDEEAEAEEEPEAPGLMEAEPRLSANVWSGLVGTTGGGAAWGVCGVGGALSERFLLEVGVDEPTEAPPPLLFCAARGDEVIIAFFVAWTWLLVYRPPAEAPPLAPPRAWWWW